MVGPLIVTLLHIYCWVCFERTFEIAWHLAKLSMGKVDASSTLCRKMKNLLQIWHVAGRNCCNNISLQLVLLRNLDSVIHKYQTGIMSTTSTYYSPTDAISDWTLIVCSSFVMMSFFLFDRYVYSRSFCEFFSMVTVNMFCQWTKWC